MKLFKEYLVCPDCGEPIASKEELLSEEKKPNYCGMCGEKIASTCEKALAIVTKEATEQLDRA